MLIKYLIRLFEPVSVSYWAVGQGSCCNTKTCDDWTSTLGGIRLKFFEFYPNVDVAVSKVLYESLMSAESAELSKCAA